MQKRYKLQQLDKPLTPTKGERKWVVFHHVQTVEEEHKNQCPVTTSLSANVTLAANCTVKNVAATVVQNVVRQVHPMRERFTHKAFRNQ